MLLVTWPTGARYTLTATTADGRLTALYLVGNPDKLAHVPG